MKTTTKTITLIVLGTGIEIYDFVIYSFMSVFIADIFFPVNSDTTNLLIALATFGVAFLMRPLGGIFLGRYADRVGRSQAMNLGLLLMSLSMAAIAFLPPFSQIGYIAPIVLVFARLVQGFAAGGVFGTATSIIIELAPLHRRGFYGSWQMVGQAFAILFGGCVGMSLTMIFSTEQIITGAWRIPFIIGLLIIPIAHFIRKNLEALPHAKHNQILHTDIVEEQHTNTIKNVFIVAGVVVGGSVATYINYFYMPTYATKYLHLPMQNAFLILNLSLFITTVLAPVFGSLSDKIGRKPILLSAIILYFSLTYPLFFWLTSQPSLYRLGVTQLIFCVVLSAYFGPFATFGAEQFSRQLRSTALGISYNLGVLLFGGFAQFFVTWLIHYTQTPMAITYYLYMGSVIAIFCLLLAKPVLPAKQIQA